MWAIGEVGSSSGVCATPCNCHWPRGSPHSVPSGRPGLFQPPLWWGSQQSDGGLLPSLSCHPAWSAFKSPQTQDQVDMPSSEKWNRLRRVFQNGRVKVEILANLTAQRKALMPGECYFICDTCLLWTLHAHRSSLFKSGESISSLSKPSSFHICASSVLMNILGDLLSAGF